MVALGPDGTREGRAWRKRLVSVSSTPGRGRNIEGDPPLVL